MIEVADTDPSARHRIYQYVERNGAVEPEKAQRQIRVRPQTGSKPARSGEEYEPAVQMPTDEFRHHVSILKRDGYLEERDGKLRVSVPMDDEAETVSVSGMEATIRPARQEDLTGIVGVIDTIASQERYIVARALAEKLDRDQVLLRHNDDENRIFFVATIDDDAVGWLHAEATQNPGMDHTAQLTMGVLPEHRGHGLGSKLMERGLDWAESQEYMKVYQNLSATNERAIAFLEDNGWAIESRRDGHYCLDGELVDEVQLAIWLDDSTVCE